MKFFLFLCILISLVFNSFSQISIENKDSTERRTLLIDCNRNLKVFGCNFIPSTAVNQIEMWEAKTFDTATIAKELGYASSLGMNVVRVYLHDLVFYKDPDGFLNRIDLFLKIAHRFNLKTLLVFFDSCWDPYPHIGKQPLPMPGIHNSRWVQSPGYYSLRDTMQYKRLAVYLKSVVRKFRFDSRIFGWDVWNEPDFDNNLTKYYKDLPNKSFYVLPLLKMSFDWIRSENPSQPLTSALWNGTWSDEGSLSSIEKVQIAQSDIISFHCYQNAFELEKKIRCLQKYGKTVLCTEYLARSVGSTFEDCLPVFVKYNIGAINWGLVSGKTQTIYPWDSWRNKYMTEPSIWLHDIFKQDGTPFCEDEIRQIKRIIFNYY